MRRNYPATRAGLRRLGRDMQKEIEKGMKPVSVPVRYEYRTGLGGVTVSRWAGAVPLVTNNYGDINHHYGDVVSVDGDSNFVAIGNEGPVNQVAGQPEGWQVALMAALGNVHSRIDELDLDEHDRDTVEDCVASAARIAASDEVDDRALKRRGRRVLDILEKIMTAASGGVVAQSLAEPLKQLLS